MLINRLTEHTIRDMGPSYNPSRRTGKTTAFCLEVIARAMQSPGVPIIYRGARAIDGKHLQRTLIVLIDRLELKHLRVTSTDVTYNIFYEGDPNGLYSECGTYLQKGGCPSDY